MIAQRKASPQGAEDVTGSNGGVQISPRRHGARWTAPSLLVGDYSRGIFVCGSVGEPPNQTKPCFSNQDARFDVASMDWRIS